MKFEALINNEPFIISEGAVIERLRRDPSVSVAKRVMGLLANTSSKSPEELENLSYLDTEGPGRFAASMMALHHNFGTRILGGCCGTDGRHIQAIAKQINEKMKMS
jgi:homocysteine S-methyltransferase